MIDKGRDPFLEKNSEKRNMGEDQRGVGKRLEKKKGRMEKVLDWISARNRDAVVNMWDVNKKGSKQP